MMGKILSLLLVEHMSAENIYVVHRFLSGITVILSMVIISAVLASVLCVGIGYVSYLELISHGFDPLYVIAFMAMAIMLILLAFVTKIRASIEDLKTLPLQLLRGSKTHGITSIGRAFLDGFLSPPVKR